MGRLLLLCYNRGPRADLVLPVKSLGTDGMNQCGSVRNNAGARYIMPVNRPGTYRHYRGTNTVQ